MSNMPGNVNKMTQSEAIDTHLHPETQTKGFQEYPKHLHVTVNSKEEEDKVRGFAHMDEAFRHTELTPNAQAVIAKQAGDLSARAGTTDPRQVGVPTDRVNMQPGQPGYDPQYPLGRAQQQGFERQVGEPLNQGNLVNTAGQQYPNTQNPANPPLVPSPYPAEVADNAPGVATDQSNWAKKKKWTPESK